MTDKQYNRLINDIIFKDYSYVFDNKSISLARISYMITVIKKYEEINKNLELVKNFYIFLYEIDKANSSNI